CVKLMDKPPSSPVPSPLVPSSPILSASNLPGAIISSQPSTPTVSASTPLERLQSNEKPEKLYKKEKQILIEFDLIVKDIRYQLNEQLKCLEQRLEVQLSILSDIQDYFKRRAEVELDYAKNLDNLHKQTYQRHKAQKARRETWVLHSVYKLWDSIVHDTRTHVKYHTVMSDICGKYMSDKFNEIAEDTRRMFGKCKSVGQASHEDIFKVLNELQSTMKTYHQYQSESKQAEQKLRQIQQQMAKLKSVKKQKSMEKRVEKRQMKYTETKVKAFKARNDYLLTIESVNAALTKYCTDDVPDLIDCMNFGFHTSTAKCLMMYLSAQENIKRSRQMTIENLNRSIGDLDTVGDKQKYLEYYLSVFTIPRKIKFEPHKGDEVSTVNAQVLIREEMQQRFGQLQNRLASLKTENDEIFKTIEATEQSLMNYINVKNSDLSDLFKDLNLPQSAPKDTRKEIEDYYIEKFKQYTLSSNLISRLQARHDVMQKALGASPAPSQADEKCLIRRPNKPKQIGKAPIIGRPRLFGGKLIDYIQVTQQDIPLIISSCVSAINRLGLHNQGIFRVPGAQVDINQFKDIFEKGEDPLVNVSARDMNSVAGCLKLYFRELKEPLFPRDMFDSFMACIIGVESEEKCVENLRQVVKLLPRPIFIVMRYFFAFLNHLAEYSDENMMDGYNLASCLAPSLMPIPEDKDQVQYLTHTIELIRTVITHHEEIFPNDGGPVYEKFATISIDVEEGSDRDEDDEGISEQRSLHREGTGSDDETEAIEALAQFNYCGRTDKELSFKKNDTIYIYRRISNEWWQGHLLNGQMGCVPDKYIKFKKRRRISSSNNVLVNLIDPSLLNSISVTTSNELDDRVSQSPDIPLVDELHFKSAKETDILDNGNEEESDDDINTESNESLDINVNSYVFNGLKHTSPPSRPIHNVSLPSPPMMLKNELSVRVPSANDQQMIDIDTALREVLSGIRTVEECHAQCFRSMPTSLSSTHALRTELDRSVNILETIASTATTTTTTIITATPPSVEAATPDLVLNLPVTCGLITPPASKCLDSPLTTDYLSNIAESSTSSSPLTDEPLSVTNNSTALIESQSISPSRFNSSVYNIEKVNSPESSNRKIPPQVMKKPEKTIELLKKLGLTDNHHLPTFTSSCSSSSSTTSSNLTSPQNIFHAQIISVPAGTSKSTDV
ncbi:unnamed protein product, partial [Didymodactylos carnosus]